MKAEAKKSPTKIPKMTKTMYDSEQMRLEIEEKKFALDKLQLEVGDTLAQTRFDSSMRPLSRYEREQKLLRENLELLLKIRESYSTKNGGKAEDVIGAVDIRILRLIQDIRPVYK